MSNLFPPEWLFRFSVHHPIVTALLLTTPPILCGVLAGWVARAGSARRRVVIQGATLLLVAVAIWALPALSYLSAYDVLFYPVLLAATTSAVVALPASGDASPWSLALVSGVVLLLGAAALEYVARSYPESRVVSPQPENMPWFFYETVGMPHSAQREFGGTAPSNRVDSSRTASSEIPHCGRDERECDVCCTSAIRSPREAIRNPARRSRKCLPAVSMLRAAVASASMVAHDPTARLEQAARARPDARWYVGGSPHFAPDGHVVYAEWLADEVLGAGNRLTAGNTK